MMRIYSLVAVTLTLAWGLTSSAAKAQQSPTFKSSKVTESSKLYCQFIRYFKDTNQTDTLKGAFYYLEPGRIHIEIEHPINQIMLIHNNLTTIYYPDQNKGFLIEGKAPMILPILPSIIAATRPDYGLTDLSYQIYDQSVRQDTLLTHWRHTVDPEGFGQFHLARAGEQLAYVVYEMPEGAGEIRSIFDEFTTVGGLTFPLEIQTENTLTKAKEWFQLVDIAVNPPIPPHVSDFKIPTNADVEKRTW